MAPINDPSIVFIKAAQYLVNQKLQSLKDSDRKYTFKAASIDASVPSDARSFQQLSAKGAGLNPICPREQAHVAIIGAGVAGLRTAMFLQRMNIAHTIFEANDAPGGRVFTYHFPSDPVKSPPGKHDYYEVGATSFPENIANKPTFDLFEELGLTFRGPKNPAGQLIPFLEQSKQNIHHYNNRKGRVVRGTSVAGQNDLARTSTDLHGLAQAFTDPRISNKTINRPSERI